MKRYELTATTAKSDIIAGLIFPVIIMTPILAIQLIPFYLKLNDFFKSYPVLLLLIVLVFLSASFLLVKKWLGVGVQNSTEDMKKYCNYITDATCDENAVAEVIHRFVLNNL